MPIQLLAQLWCFSFVSVYALAARICVGTMEVIMATDTTVDTTMKSIMIATMIATITTTMVTITTTMDITEVQLQS